MKKRLFSLFLILLLLAALIPAALAEETTATVFPHVLDGAQLLNDDQRESLEQKAAALSEEHQCSLYIVTVEDHTDFDPDVYEATTGIFEYYCLGWGDEHDGVILLLSMKERDYAFSGHGSRGETICSYENSRLIEDAFLDNLRNDDWNGGFIDYLDACDAKLTELEKSEGITAPDNITASDSLNYNSNNNSSAKQYSLTFLRYLPFIFIPEALALLAGMFAR